MKQLLITLTLIMVGIMNAFAQINVTATVGTPGPTSYTTLKAAFDAVNLGTHKGVITIQVTGNTTETETAALNASGSGSASYTSVSIYPTATGLSISGNLAAPLIDLNGADNVTIDGRVNQGGSTVSLTIANTSLSSIAGTSTISFINDATTNNVRYCNIKGSNTDGNGGVVFFRTAAITGNDNNIIEYNNLTSNSDANRPQNMITSLGSAGFENNGIIIRNNNFYNFSYDISINKLHISSKIDIDAIVSILKMNGELIFSAVSNFKVNSRFWYVAGTDLYEINNIKIQIINSISNRVITEKNLILTENY